MTQPSIFVSYSHKDEVEKDKLLSHLGVLQRAGLINLWSDDRIGAGADWQREIDQAITQAKVAILLISANFLTSDFILGQEVPALLKRRQEEGVVVFPVIATACAWRMVDWLAAMQVRPKNGRPVWSDGGSHVNEDLAEIAEEVAQIVSGLNNSAAESTAAANPQPVEATPSIQTLDDRDWDSLLYRIQAGRCTPFIGPDVNQDIFLADHDMAASWARIHAYPFKDNYDFPRVAQFLAVRRDPAFPADELSRQLEEVETLPDFTNPNEPHSFLAGLPLPIYVTTNYDNFMVKALRHQARNVHQDVCRWNRYVKDIPSVFDPDSPVTVSRTNPVVYHLFGQIDTPESMVLTEDDYLDFLVNISRNPAIIPRQIEKALVQSSLLFIGYKITDIRFRILFRGLVASLQRSLRRTSIAVQLAPEPANSAGITSTHVREYIEEYLAKDDVRVFWGDSVEFITELRTRWEAFNQGR